MQEVLSVYYKYLGLFLDSTWIWMPFLLAVAFFYSWMYYVQRLYWRRLEWVVLEVKPPREIERTPKTMEQIFAGLWGSFGTVGSKYEKYIKGKLQDYFSFEIVGANGEIHFYLRVLKKYRDLVEAQVYSQYPQAEIKEVEDYVKSVPLDVPNKNWDLWGTKLKLAADPVYPIRTYQHLIDITTTKQPSFLDPLAGLMENMGKLRNGEQIWIQLLFRPAADDWRKKADDIVNKLMKREKKAEQGLISKEIKGWVDVASSVTSEFITGKPSEAAKKEDKKESFSMMMLSPGERIVLEGMAEKTSKKGYEAKMQWAYIGRREVYNSANIAAVMGVINQFANLNMNLLKPDNRSITKANYAFAKFRKAYRQRKLMKLMRTRSYWEPGYILNIEELATLYHFPTVAVQAPMTPYIEVKKGGAPIDLPIE